MRIHNMLEVRLLYKQLEGYSKRLELEVMERTAELRESEARYRGLTELASDWYWEQDETMKFTKVSGPVLDLLGIQVDTFADDVGDEGLNGVKLLGWNETEREFLRAKIAEREPFIDYILSREDDNGSIQKYQISGEPMFDKHCRFRGYRGIGFELTGRK